MKLNTIIKIDIICSLISFATSIPIVAHTINDEENIVHNEGIEKLITNDNELIDLISNELPKFTTTSAQNTITSTTTFINFEDYMYSVLHQKLNTETIEEIIATTTQNIIPTNTIEEIIATPNQDTIPTKTFSDIIETNNNTQDKSIPIIFSSIPSTTTSNEAIKETETLIPPLDLSNLKVETNEDDNLMTSKDDSFENENKENDFSYNNYDEEDNDTNETNKNENNIYYAKEDTLIDNDNLMENENNNIDVEIKVDNNNGQNNNNDNGQENNNVISDNNGQDNTNVNNNNNNNGQYDNNTNNNNNNNGQENNINNDNNSQENNNTNIDNKGQENNNINNDGNNNQDTINIPYNPNTAPSETTINHIEPKPTEQSATNTEVPVLNTNANVVCWTLPDIPCCTHCNYNSKEKIDNNIVKYWGEENGKKCGISDKCLKSPINTQDTINNSNDVNNGNPVLDLNQSINQNTTTINNNDHNNINSNNFKEEKIMISICWSASLPCCKDCNIVTASDKLLQQYLGWENDQWCAIPDRCLEGNNISNLEGEKKGIDDENKLMINNIRIKEKKVKEENDYVKSNCWTYPFYPCCTDCKSAQILSNAKNNEYLGWENNDWCGIPDECL